MKNQENAKADTTIYDAIREMVLNLEIKPGEKINQQEMAKKLNTSRTPVVNVLHRLESEGLVDSIRHSGFFVHRLTVQELLDLFELREALDLVIIRNLVDTLSDEDIDELEKPFKEFASLSENEKEENYRRLDMKFHSSLARLCSNRMLVRINDSMQVFGRSYTAGLLRPVPDTLEEHLQILEALRNRDPDAAEKASREHIAKTKRIIKKTVEGMRKMGLDPASMHLDEISLTPS